MNTVCDTTGHCYQDGGIVAATAGSAGPDISSVAYWAPPQTPTQTPAQAAESWRVTVAEDNSTIAQWQSEARSDAIHAHLHAAQAATAETAMGIGVWLFAAFVIAMIFCLCEGSIRNVIWAIRGDPESNDDEAPAVDPIVPPATQLGGVK